MDSILQQLCSGEVTAVSGLIWLLIASVFSIIGGAVAGLVLAGKDLGNDLASMMGGMFGPTAAVPAVLVGLVVLCLL